MRQPPRAGHVPRVVHVHEQQRATTAGDRRSAAAVDAQHPVKRLALQLGTHGAAARTRLDRLDRHLSLGLVDDRDLVGEMVPAVRAEHRVRHVRDAHAERHQLCLGVKPGGGRTCEREREQGRAGGEEGGATA